MAEGKLEGPRRKKRSSEKMGVPERQSHDRISNLEGSESAIPRNAL